MKHLLPLLLLLTSCATGQRFVDDYADARQDGTIDAAEMKVLDRDAADLDDALHTSPLPPGTPLSPWLELLFPIVTSAAAGYVAHKRTMSVRDRLAAAKAPEETTPTA